MDKEKSITTHGLNEETAVYANKTIKVDFDGTIKSFFESYSDANIIRFINAAFQMELPLSSRVEKLSTETHNDGKKRLSDIIIKVFTDIDEHAFHIEAEAGNDNDMALRMFEYGVRGALMHGKTLG